MKQKIMQITAIVISFVAIIISIISLCVCLKTVPSGEENDLKVTDGAGNELLTDGTAQAMPANMVFGARALSATNEARAATTSVTLTATLTPSNATDNWVDWLVRYHDGTTADVTNYITVTPTSAGSLTAKVTYIQPFSKQIDIVATARGGDNVSATCVCDCLKEFVYAEISLDSLATEAIYIDDNEHTLLLLTQIFDGGTVTPSATIKSFKIGFTETFWNKLITADNWFTNMYAGEQTITGDKFVCNKAFLYAFIDYNLSPLDKSDFLNAFKTAGSDMTYEHFTIAAECELSYANKSLGTVTFTRGYKFNVSNLVTSTV